LIDFFINFSDCAKYPKVEREASNRITFGKIRVDFKTDKKTNERI
jgi:hypothetical protein